ncbi:MAG TPA: phosphate starvation-inducible protein PhoH, partial [Acidimicrobiaceae bacterium]|nr:phosphate starvation-inducible protein PhoH [Acidimicrobiaceae bacterium]
MDEKQTLSLAGIDPLALFGKHDEHLSFIEKKYGVTLVARGDALLITGKGDSVSEASGLLTHLVDRLRKGPKINESELAALIQQSPAPPAYEEVADEQNVAHTYKGCIRPRTRGQVRYIEAIAQNDIVFGIGPAGTGKTYQAVACAVSALKNNEVEKIIITRPVVEAGERLGFLPG